MVMVNSSTALKLNNLSSGILSGHFIFNREYDADRLHRQFARPQKYSHNVTYSLTTDENLKKQYFAIRQSVYKEAYNFNDTAEDITDKNSQIFVARAGAGNVIGGIRLTVSTPENPKMLPIESCGANLREIFPGIDFNKVIFGEAGRSAVLSDYRGGDVCDRLQLMSKEYFVKEMGAEIGFGSADLVNLRRLKKFFTRMGYNFIARLDKRITVPGVDTELYLWAIDFTKDGRFAAFLNQPAQNAEKSVVADLQPEFA